MEPINETQQLKAVLQKKGWKPQELNATVKALTRLQKEKVGKQLHHFLYWSSLVLLGLTNLIGVFTLIPALMMFSGWQLTSIVAGTGIAFGMVFNYFVCALEHFERKHHILAGVFIPIVAVLDVFILLGMNEFLQWKMNFGHEDIAGDIGAFVVGFLLPYALYVLIGKHKL